VVQEPVFESSTITVTHLLPAETSIPFVNGKSTEYKTVVVPTPSVQILSPFQYTRSEYLGKSVLVINSEATATPSVGVTEVTRFIIRESPTTSVTFTPTTIRGRKTSFSHIIPSTAYSVEPVVSTLTNPLPNLGDQTQLTNLLLNQLLGLNPKLLGLQQQQLVNPSEPATPVTQYNTKTTSYVTTVTDFTSTIVKITLHGKPLKSTIVESTTNVITATEFITESTVITPTVVSHPLQTSAPLQLPALLQQQPNPNQNNLLLQSLLQLQQQQQLLNPIVPTLAPQLQVTPSTAPTTSTKGDLFDQEEESVQRDESKVPEKPVAVPKPASTVVTRYVSGKNPGEFSTILETVAANRRRREATPTATMDYVRPTALSFHKEHDDTFDNAISDSDLLVVKDNQGGVGRIELEDSYSYSDPFGGSFLSSSYNGNWATDTLESALGSSSLLAVSLP
jgi:hypothetical protein